jgi:hypothetical protein
MTINPLDADAVVSNAAADDLLMLHAQLAALLRDGAAPALPYHSTDLDVFKQLQHMERCTEELSRCTEQYVDLFSFLLRRVRHIDGLVTHAAQDSRWGYVAHLYDELLRVYRDARHCLSFLPRVDAQFSRHRDVLLRWQPAAVGTGYQSLNWFQSLSFPLASVRSATADVRIALSSAMLQLSQRSEFHRGMTTGPVCEFKVDHDDDGDNDGSAATERSAAIPLQRDIDAAPAADVADHDALADDTGHDHDADADADDADVGAVSDDDDVEGDDDALDALYVETMEELDQLALPEDPAAAAGVDV